MLPSFSDDIGLVEAVRENFELSQARASSVVAQFVLNAGLASFFLFSFYLHWRADRGVLAAQEVLLRKPELGVGGPISLFLAYVNGLLAKEKVPILLGLFQKDDASDGGGKNGPV